MMATYAPKFANFNQENRFQKGWYRYRLTIQMRIVAISLANFLFILLARVGDNGQPWKVNFLKEEAASFLEDPVLHAAFEQNCYGFCQ